jgi:hypothetical protein
MAMTDSPMSATPYEVLGVPSTASAEELRVAYRRLLRETHPDTGGDASRFIAVQAAWERIGTAEDRERYDGQRVGESERRDWAPRSSARDTRPRARSHGHPGGWRRERYLALVHEWVGRGVDIPDPYAPDLVRRAPRELRRILADALAEEATARSLADLGIGYTIWHDVATSSSDEKIDHVVLGPTGLFALLSEDFGGGVVARKGELVGHTVEGERPVHALAHRARFLARSTRTRFTGVVVVLPDDALAEPVVDIGNVRGMRAAAVTQSVLGTLMRQGLPGTRPVGGTELFELRTRLAAGIRFA